MAMTMALPRTSGWWCALTLTLLLTVFSEIHCAGDPSCPTSQFGPCFRLTSTHCVCMITDMDVRLQGIFAALGFCSFNYNDSSLISIHNEEQNKILQEKVQGLADKAWLGLKNDNGHYAWWDKSSYDYFNWEGSAPKGGPELRCFEIDGQTGIWSTTDNCFKPNLICCGVRWDLPPTPAPKQNPVAVNIVVGLVSVVAVVGIVGILVVVWQLARRRRMEREEAPLLNIYTTDEGKA